VKLNQYSFSSDTFFGLSVGPDDGGPAIVVNTWDRISAERQIFSAAHELGHLIMHLRSYDTSEESEDKQEEKEADLFASHFLMPKEGFDREWRETSGLAFPDRVMKVKRIFRVSYKTVLFRLVEEGVVDSAIWRQFNVIFEKRYRRKLSYKEEPFSEGAEPFGMDSIDFIGDRLSRLTRKAVEEEKISVSRAAEILGLPVDEMMGRLEDWESID
jgi:Zn-dependent peptidase ImmA (M78 family)